MNEKINVGLVQQSCSEDRNCNMETTCAGIRDAALHGASLVVLQELHTSLYFCQHAHPSNFDLAESIPGPTAVELGALAKELGVVIVGSVFERRAAGVFHNTAIVLERDGSLAGVYRKMHIPEDPGFHEKFYFTPGDLGFEPIQTSVGRLGVLVCWDQWYPEAARLMAMAGAQLLIYPTAIGWSPDDPEDERARQLEAWMLVQRSHAVTNGLPVVSVNRTGFEPHPSARADVRQHGIQFWGSSFVCGPQGELLVRAPEKDDMSLVVEVDLRRTEGVRRWWPFLRDRRIDAYQDLSRRLRSEK